MLRRCTLLCCLLVVPVVACQKHRWAELPAAPKSQLQAARALWQGYLKALSGRAGSRQPLQLARFFADPLLARTAPKQFAASIAQALSKNAAGAFAGVEVSELKQAPEGLLLIVDSRAGEAAIPLRRQRGRLVFANLAGACGDWTGPPRFGPQQMPDKPSLLYLKRYLDDPRAPLELRYRAAVSLSRPEFRKEIIEYQRRESNALVRLGLGLARVRLDGWDESFLRGFPTEADKLLKLQSLDGSIFEEMLVKLTNMAAVVENPPANEVLFKAARAAPPQLASRLGKALYDFAEAGPARFANAVHVLVGGEPDVDPALKLYLLYYRSRGRQAPKLTAFLKKFSRSGAGPVRILCHRLLAWLKSG